jgi:hypothetical protein
MLQSEDPEGNGLQGYGVAVSLRAGHQYLLYRAEDGIHMPLAYYLL